MENIVGGANISSGPVVVAFICSKHAMASTADLPGNIVTAQVHCAARVDVLDILKAFESGAKGVSLVMCDNETCRHPGVPARISQRVVHARQIMSSLGFGDECISVIKAEGGSDWHSTLQEAVDKVSASGSKQTTEADASVNPER